MREKVEARWFDRSAFLRGAGQRQSLLAQEGAAGRWSRVRAGSLQTGAWTFLDATEESLRNFIRTSSAGRPPRGGWLGRACDSIRLY